MSLKALKHEQKEICYGLFFIRIFCFCFVFTLFSSKVEGGRENKKPFGLVQGRGCVSDRGERHMYARVHEHLKSLMELQVIKINKNPPIRLVHIDQACVQCKYPCELKIGKTTIAHFAQ